jgi:hypothetical protein
MRPARAATLPVTLLLGLAAARAGAVSPCDGAFIRSPFGGDEVRGVVPILGSADVDAFGFYKVEFAPQPGGEDWHAVSTTLSKPVRHGVLDRWDTTTVPDGAYRLKLTIVDATGQEPCRRIVEDLVVANQATFVVSPTAPTTPTVVLHPAGPGQMPSARPADASPTAAARTEVGPAQASQAAATASAVPGRSGGSPGAASPTAGTTGARAASGSATQLAADATAESDFPIRMRSGAASTAADDGSWQPTEAVRAASAQLGAGRWPRAFLAGASAAILAGLVLSLLFGIRRQQ